MDNTIIQQGSFASTGATKYISLRSDIDWMRVYNLSTMNANQTVAVGTEFYWQRGMQAGSSITYYKSNAANAANLVEYNAGTGGFTLFDTSTNPLGPLNATITAVSAAAIPVATNSGANSLAAGDIVRITNVTGAQQLGGFDFTVGHNTLTGTTFSLDYMSQIVAGTVGSWRKINYHPLFYPRRRYITTITQAAQAVVTMSVTHGYKVGQKVRFIVPEAFGMTQMNGLLGTITAIDTTLATGNSITVDIDSTAFTAFAWPLTAAVPFTAAEVVPVGQDTGASLLAGVDILSDATENTGYIGLSLLGGGNLPGGANGNDMFWVAGKSFSVANDILA